VAASGSGFDLGERPSRATSIRDRTEAVAALPEGPVEVRHPSGAHPFKTLLPVIYGSDKGEAERAVRFSATEITTPFQKKRRGSRCRGLLFGVMMKPRTWAFGVNQWLAVMIAGLVMSACGGGGDDSDDFRQVATTSVPMENVATGTVTVNNISRTYRYYLPTNLEALKSKNLKNIRIVVSFHDQGETGEINAKQTLWHELAEANGFIVIYPEAINGSWNTTLASTGPNEVAYVQAAWTDIRTKFNISDTNAVYPTGFGTGAAMANQVAMMGPMIGFLSPRRISTP